MNVFVPFLAMRHINGGIRFFTVPLFLQRFHWNIFSHQYFNQSTIQMVEVSFSSLECHVNQKKGFLRPDLSNSFLILGFNARQTIRRHFFFLHPGKLNM